MAGHAYWLEDNPVIVTIDGTVSVCEYNHIHISPLYRLTAIGSLVIMGLVGWLFNILTK